jgi:hypothetical protein
MINDCNPNRVHQYGHVHMGYGIEHRQRLSTIPQTTNTSAAATVTAEPSSVSSSTIVSNDDTKNSTASTPSSTGVSSVTGGRRPSSSAPVTSTTTPLAVVNGVKLNPMLARQLTTYPASSPHTMFVNAAVDDTEQPFVFDLLVPFPK